MTVQRQTDRDRQRDRDRERGQRQREKERQRQTDRHTDKQGDRQKSLQRADPLLTIRCFNVIKRHDLISNNAVVKQELLFNDAPLVSLFISCIY